MGYYPSNYPNPYENANNTGLAKLLQQQHNEAIKVSESMRIDQMGREVRELRYLIDDIDRKITVDVRTPEPSVEVVEFGGFWSNLFSDPFWEIFKRPTIK